MLVFNLLYLDDFVILSLEIWTKCSLEINFKICGSENIEGLVLINILKDSLDL